jgi:hypothetical protein
MSNRKPPFLARLALASVFLILTGCASSPRGDSSGASPPPAALSPAPWSGASLRASEVPSVYMDVWRRAENRQRCALLAPARLPSASANAAPRAATFSGGWGVAYDAPDQRSAFGVAGSGTSAWSSGIYDQWPHRITWADSSRAEYGLEGGTGPNWLAYLRIPGQDCLYNVWSRQGRAHLEALLGSLRFVS